MTYGVSCGVKMWAPYQIPIALVGKELDGKPTRIASCIRRPLFATDGGETNEHISLLADFGEEIRASQIGDIIRDFKYSVSACTLCMNDTKLGKTTIERRGESTVQGYAHDQSGRVNRSNGNLAREGDPKCLLSERHLG
jgi:hypothetical protein